MISLGDLIIMHILIYCHSCGVKIATPPYQYKVKFLITRKKIVITLFYAVFTTSEEKVGN